MNKQSESGILLFGLTGTGKTNFLVGLDIVLDNQTDPNGLVHSEHAADRAYLEPLRAQWFRGEHLEHTSRMVPPPPHQLLVRHPASGRCATFCVPDLAGETFDDHFNSRSLPQEVGLQMQRATGLMLFVHCEDKADHDLLEHPSLMDAGVANDNSSDSLMPSTEWSTEQTFKQVKLVDLLQFVSEMRKSPLRIAVIISAWDLLSKVRSRIVPREPTLFLSRQWPLLAQYLETNCGLFPYRTYGVSARGGGTTPEEIARLTKMIQPCDRVRVVDGEHSSNDLTRPVRWLLGLLENTDCSND